MIVPMTLEEKATYKMLRRKCQQKHYKLFDPQSWRRIKSRKPNAYNNQLVKMQEFLSSLPGDYSNNGWIKSKPVI